MIQAQHLSDAQRAAMVQRDLSALPPLFHTNIQSGLDECNASGLDAFVYEALRSDALERAYYELGRSVKPPDSPVTNADSALYSWHGFALATDIISKSKLWSAPRQWFEDVAAIMKRHGCDWGGDWLGSMSNDVDHFQFAGMPPSPTARHRQLYATGGLISVWQDVGAA